MLRYPSVISTFIFSALLILSHISYAGELRLGFTGPLSGPSAKVGEQLIEGIEMGLARTNASRVLPYKLTLIAKDDGYEPQRTPLLIQQLVNQDDIVSLISSVGTPTIVSAIPTLKEFQIPLISPFTGSSALKQDEIRSLIFDQRANYHDEAKLLAKTVVEEFGIEPSDMAIYVQKDSYGDGVMRSLTGALKPYGLNSPHDILQLHYERNHPAAEDAVAKVLSHPKQPKAIFLISTYPAAAGFISLLHEVGITPLFVTFSFVSHDILIEQLLHTDAKILSSLVRPCIDQRQHPLVQEFLEDVRQHGNLGMATPLVFEGYLAARYVEAALRHQSTNTPPTRAEFLELLRQYERARQPTSTSLAISDKLEHAEYPIWLELQDLKNKQHYCGSALPLALKRGSL